MKFEIDTDKLKVLADEAGKLFVDPDSESKLVELAAVKDEFDKIWEAVKFKLEFEAVKLNPEFSSIKGDNVKVMYRSYGARYKLDDSLIDKVPPALYEIKTSYSANVKAIEEYIEANEGKVPLGIVQPERNKQISISIKKDEQVEG